MTEQIPIISVSDFKYWLQGVEAMMDEGWHPSLDQWRKIRSKIDQLDEYNLFDVVDGVIARLNTKQIPAPVFQQPVWNNPPSIPIPRQPEGQPVSNLPPMTPPGNSNLPSTFYGKTPDVDSSGGYVSPFVG